MSQNTIYFVGKALLSPGFANVFIYVCRIHWQSRGTQIASLCQRHLLIHHFDTTLNLNRLGSRLSSLENWLMRGVPVGFNRFGGHPGNRYLLVKTASVACQTWVRVGHHSERAIVRLFSLLRSIRGKTSDPRCTFIEGTGAPKF